MYRLIVDKQMLDDYVNAIAPSVGADPSTIHQALYVLLRHHSRPLIDSIFGESIPPVKMLVTIRTDRSNEVLVPDDGKFYTDCTDSYFDEHPLDDTVMLAAKSLVDKLFDCGDNIPAVIQRTTVYPLGACVRDDRAYVYANVVIDHTLKNDSIFKTKGCHFESITSITPTSPLEEELLKHLTLVKGGNESV